MGWSFSSNLRHSKEDQVRENLRGFSQGIQVLDDAVVGNNHWILIELPSGDRLITLTLMKSGYPSYGWGYKNLDETQGPSEVDCPLRLLTKASEPKNETSRDWRERVRQFHAQASAYKKAKAALGPGDHLLYGGKWYELVESQGRKGWLVRCLNTGATFRAKASQIAFGIREGRFKSRQAVADERLAQELQFESRQRQASCVQETKRIDLSSFKFAFED